LIYGFLTRSIASIKKTAPSIGSSQRGPLYVAISKPVTKALQTSRQEAS